MLKNFQLAKTFLILRNKVEAIREVLHFENGIEHKILITHVIEKISDKLSLTTNVASQYLSGNLAWTLSAQKPQFTTPLKIRLMTKRAIQKRKVV